MQGSVVEGFSQTAISGSQWFIVWELCKKKKQSPRAWTRSGRVLDRSTLFSLPTRRRRTSILVFSILAILRWFGKAFLIGFSVSVYWLNFLSHLSLPDLWIELFSSLWKIEMCRHSRSVLFFLHQTCQWLWHFLFWIAIACDHTLRVSKWHTGVVLSLAGAPLKDWHNGGGGGGGGLSKGYS